MAYVTVDISLSLLTSLMSPRRNNLEHFTRDTRPPPVGPAHVMRGRDVIYSQDCATDTGQETCSSYTIGA